MARYFGILILSLLISLSFSSVYGTVNSASTDKLLYQNGDSIIISGNVDYDSEIPSIIIQIITPSGTGLAHIAAVVPQTSGSFTSLPIHAGGPTCGRLQVNFS